MLNEAAILAIIKFVQLGIAAAPVVEKAVLDAKIFINNLFLARLITAEQQDNLHAHVDDVGTLFAAGRDLPTHWTVQPDPA